MAAPFPPTILNLPNVRQAKVLGTVGCQDHGDRILPDFIAKIVPMGSNPFFVGDEPRREHRARIRLRGAAPLVVVAAVLGAISFVVESVAAGPLSPVDTTSAAELVRQAVTNQIAAAEDSSVRHQFRALRKNGRGSQTKLYVETRDAIAGMVIAYDDRPVTDAELASQEAHLQGLLDHPEQLRRKHAQEKEDADRTLRILRAIPDAYLFEYAGTETATADYGKAGDELVRLKFRPNPNYTAPSRVEQAMGAAEGTVLIDAVSQRLARIDGALFKDATYGWGFLGRVDKGGHFVVEQADLGDGSWGITRMDLKFTGKILVVRNFGIVSNELFSDFHRVSPDMTFAQGVELLKEEHTKIAQDSGGKSR
jgi:hypothetical protein